MVSECPSFVLAAVTAKPFAKLFQQTKSSCKAGEVVRVGFGRDFFFVRLFVALAVKGLVAGRRRGTAAASTNTSRSCSGLSPSDSDVFNGLAQVSVHMLGFGCGAKCFRFYEWPLKHAA